MSQGNVGEKLGSFRLDEVLGSGAMGVVFRATHETTGRPAAVKLIHNELSEKGKVFDRFEREAEILKQFRHPSIVRWLAWGRYKGTYYFAMEFVEGVTLERVVQDRGEIPWREVVDLAIQLCDALHYAHEKSIVHRDLKPSNLMITVDGKLKLTDFGIAKDLDRTTQLTAPGRTLGTAAYMAPEQIRGTPAVSHKTDLYSLGVLMYQMLTGRPPFEGASAVVLMHCHLNEPPPRPSAHVETIPEELDNLVVKLMAKSPADRPWDAAAVGEALKDLRDRAERGQPIAMVWPEPGSPGSNPIRAGVGTPTGRSRTKRTKSGTSSRTSWVFSAFDPDAGGVLSWLASRRVLETVGMVALLLAIGTFIAYWVWPPSAEYLYRQAAALMASTHRADWLTAQDEYFDLLDRKYPNHPYKDQILKWRDKIQLEEADGRAKNLSSPIKTQFSEPHTNGERQFVTHDTLARKAVEDGNERQAAIYWREMARVLKPDDREDRKWYLLAIQRAEEIDARLQERRAFVTDQLARAEQALREGRNQEVDAIRAMLREKYSQYADLADLLGAAPTPKPEPPRPPSEPENLPHPADHPEKDAPGHVPP
jgi:serine/threonine-protein kinase